MQYVTYFIPKFFIKSEISPFQNTFILIKIRNFYLQKRMRKLPQKFDQQKVELCYGKWNGKRNLEAMRQIKQWGVFQLELCSNHRQTAIQDISHIKFTRLMILDLGSNEISSIQRLQNLFLPHLQELSLYSNDISTAKTLKKTQWPNMENFVLIKNYILDGDSLAYCYFPKLKRLMIDGYFPYNQIFDLRSLMKIQGLSLHYFSIKSGRKSYQPYFEKYFNEKCKHLSIHFYL